MTSKVPTAEEVLALVSAAAASPSEPTMQQLLLQVQQAQLLQHQQHQQNQQADAEAAAAAMGMSMNMAMHAQAGDAAAAADAAIELMDAVGVDAASMVASMSAAAAAATTTASTAATHAAAPSVATPTATAPATMDVTTMGTQSSTADPNGASAAANSSAIRRKSIPLSMKKQAIEWILGPGKGVPSRAEKHFSALNWDVSASSFRKWWKNRDKIMNDSSTKKRISGGGRKPYLEESEERLLVIVIQERAKKDRVTRKWIAKTAQHMFQRTNANFKASENWVTKFIRRNGLTLKRSYVTYDHTAEATAGTLANSGSATSQMQALGMVPGAIEIHDDDDDMDDDEPENENENMQVDSAAGAASHQTADAIVV